MRSLLRWGDVSGKPAEFAPSSHTHAAADIVSGTLPVERGGTGAATASAAREALGIVSPWSPGDAKFTHAATLEPGWIEKDGRALNRITYAALFAAIGTAYGIGDGATTFNIPDDRGRMIIGSGNAPGRSNRQRGQTGGEESVTLTTAHIPEHEHEAGTLVTDVEPDHTHTAFIEQGIGESSTTPGTADTASDNATGVTGGIITISSDGEQFSWSDRLDGLRRRRTSAQQHAAVLRQRGQ